MSTSRRHPPERSIRDTKADARRLTEPMAEQIKKAEARLAIQAAASRILELALVGSGDPDPRGEEGDR